MAAKKKTAAKAKAPAKRKAEMKKHGPRADKGAPIDPLIAKLGGETRVIVERLRALVHRAVPEVTESIKWGQPVFEHQGLLCHIRPSAKYVRFGFFRDAGYDDPKNELQGTGLGGHLKIAAAKDIDEARLLGWLRQAAEFNARGG